MLDLIRFRFSIIFFFWLDRKRHLFCYLFTAQRWTHSFWVQRYFFVYCPAGWLDILFFSPRRQSRASTRISRSGLFCLINKGARAKTGLFFSSRLPRGAGPIRFGFSVIFLFTARPIGLTFFSSPAARHNPNAVRSNCFIYQTFTLRHSNPLHPFRRIHTGADPA